MLEDYLKVKTGRDLIELGIVPKESSKHLALIVKRRLEAVKDHILAQITPGILGEWKPAIEYTREAMPHEVTDPDLIRKYAKVGAHVVGVGVSEDNKIDGLEGVIRSVKGDILGIEFKERPPKGHSLSGMV